jgi:hypothetical protein
MRQITALDVQAKLKALRQAGVHVYGSDVHHFQLNPPLAEDDVVRFETLYRIKLPGYYRDFLTSTGNGGAGPYNGIFALGEMDHGFGHREWKERDGSVGTLSASFPFQTPWNDLTGMPSANLADEDEDVYDAQMRAFENRYWSPSLVDGAIPISHAGCAIRILLVVTGNQRGFLWRDSRSEYTGLAPLCLADGTPATFSGWYTEWLLKTLPG